MHRVPSLSRLRWLATAAGFAAAVLLGPGLGPALAHPGNTAADGCHYCRTNCASWGVPQDQRHCHNGGGGGGTTSGGSTSGGSAPPPPTDTTPPPDPTVSGVTVDGATVSVSVSAESGSTIRVLVGGSIATSARATGAAQTVSFRVPDGSHRVEIVARDAAGNESGSVVRAVTIDTVAPEAPTVTVTAPSAPSSPWVDVTIAGERGATWRLHTAVSSADGAAAPVADSGTLPASGSAAVSLLLANGTHAVLVTLEDGVGNVSTEVLEDVIVELPAPSAPSLALASDEGASPVEVAVTGTPHGTVELTTAGRDGRPIEVSLDEDGEGTAALELEDGEHTLTGTAVDFQGQVSDAAAVLRTTVDTTAPDVAASVDEVVLADGRLAWTVSAEPGSTVTVRSTSAGIDETYEAADAPASGELQPSAGEHTITVAAVDAYGNTTEQAVLATVAAPGSLAGSLTGMGLLGALAYGGYRLTRRRRDGGAGDDATVTAVDTSHEGADGLDLADDEGGGGEG